MFTSTEQCDAYNCISVDYLHLLYPQTVCLWWLYSCCIVLLDLKEHCSSLSFYPYMYWFWSDLHKALTQMFCIFMYPLSPFNIMVTRNNSYQILKFFTRFKRFNTEKTNKLVLRSERSKFRGFQIIQRKMLKAMIKHTLRQERSTKHHK